MLQTPITEIDNSLGELHYNDNLICHYAGGVAFAALKKWEQAEEFFEICVSSPAQVPAAIQFEAFKKLTLVQLISRGTVSLSMFRTYASANKLERKTAAVPKYTHNSLIRLLKVSPYGSFAKAYPQQIATLKKIAESDAAVFTNVSPQSMTSPWIVGEDFEGRQYWSHQPSAGARTTGVNQKAYVDISDSQSG